MQIDNVLCHPSLAKHQKEAILAACYNHRGESRIQVIMACGTGKTRVGAAIALEEGSLATIVFLPSLALIRQTLPEWLKTPFQGGFDFLCVCSDETVVQTDEARVTPEEIEQEFGAGQRRVTTSPYDVRCFLESATGRKVLFVTYHSADVVRDGLPDGFQFDLGLYDEAHRTAGKRSRFNASLRDTHTPIARRVFMTATPKHSDYSHRNKEGEAKVVFSMDDKTVYGKVAYRLPIREAINRGIITDYKVLISVITDQMVANDFAQRGLRKPDNSDKLDLGVYAQAIGNAMNKYGLKKALSFHNAVNHAAALADERVTGFPEDVVRFHVNGTQSTGERNQVLSHFAAASRGLVTNARCLTEGVDVPEIDLVTFVHPKKSRVDIVQAVGRALRRPPASGKECGYILLPLFVHEATREFLEAEVLSESGYEALWETIQALREQDEMLDAVIREGVMSGSAGGLVKFIQIDGPLSQELKGLIGTACLEEVGDSWDKYYGILKRLHDSGRNAGVASKTVIDGLKVGIWLSNQCAAYKEGRLTPERVTKLEAIEIIWHEREAAWEKHYAILKCLHDSGQDANVPRTTVIDRLNVGSWLHNQCVAYKNGGLSPERVTRLEAIKVIWNVQEAAWEKRYAILKRLYANGEDANVPQGTVIDRINVGQWLNNQCQAYMKGRLTPERTAKLGAVGVVFGNRSEAAWEKHYATLKRLHDNGQDANVPYSTVIDEMNVGQWLSIQRTEFKNSRLSPERTAKLGAIGVVFGNRSEAAWEKYYATLKRLHDNGQDANVPITAVIDGLKVGAWLGQQRDRYKKGRLSPKRAAKLEASSIVWDQQEATWEANYAILKSLHDKGQDANVLSKTVIDELNVGQWLSTQRRKFKNGRLSPEHAAKLETIEIIWNVREAAWEKHYDILKCLHDNGQDVNAPVRTAIDALNVGLWLRTQRHDYKNGRLSPELIARLVALGVRLLDKSTNDQ